MLEEVAREEEQAVGGDDLVKVIDDHRRGERHDGAERLAVLEAVAQRAVGAHRDATDERVLAASREREHPTRHLHELLAHEAPVVVVDLGLVQVERVVARGHDHGDPVILGPAADAGLTDPVRMVARDAMQQEERLERGLLGRVGALLPGAHLVLEAAAGVAHHRVRGVCGTLVVDGEDDLERGGAHEGGGEVINANEGHGVSFGLTRRTRTSIALRRRALLGRLLGGLGSAFGA